MNFFEHQAQARRKSARLLALFVLAVVVIVALINLIVLFAVIALTDERLTALAAPSAWIAAHPAFVAWTSIGTIGFIVGASVYKMLALGNGGAVARALGGVLVDGDAGDPLRRQLLNVVEEIAIAAGVAVPDVYVLEEEGGLNAFAAGFGSGDASVIVTRGLLEHLTREELQGVIAHEFSHIFNGDMKLNMRLIGMLHGILVIALTGRTILRGSTRSRGKGVALAATIGLALTVIGYIGVLCARFIKAAVSREREYLADASAVQFTRNPDGIGGALRKIASYVRGGRVASARGEEVSHMMFAEARNSWDRMFATHPSILERIKRIQPRFDPASLEPVTRLPLVPLAVAAHDERVAQALRHDSDEAIPLTAAEIVSEIGHPGYAQLQDAQALHAAIPVELMQAVHSPAEAVAVVLALTLSADAPTRARQCELIAQRVNRAAATRVEAIATVIVQLGHAFRLPLLELSFPALKRRPAPQLRALLASVEALVRVDGRVDLFEFVLTVVLRTQLRDAQPVAERPHGKLIAEREALSVVFAALAQTGHRDGVAARAAFQRGLHRLLPQVSLRFTAVTHWQRVDDALQRLDALAPLAKQELVAALAETATHDGLVTLYEAELLRALCAALHCPLPPLRPRAAPAEASAIGVAQ